MKKLLLVLLLPIFMFSCIEDDIIEIDNCLSGVDITFFDGCDEKASEFCDDIRVVEKLLPESVKTQLGDFCYQIDDEMIFQDSAGNPMKFIVINKALVRRGAVFANPDTSQHCFSYCLESEYGALYLDSENIDLYFQLITEFNDDFKSSNDVSKEVQTTLVVYETKPLGTNGTQHLSILSIPYLNYLDEEMPIDTSINAHYQSIELNGKSYQNVTTSIRRINSYIQVYYSFDEGFIGFKDASDKIWTRQ